MSKIRHIDFYPDEYISGVATEMTLEEQGLYWMICSLIYSRGGPIADDAGWLRAKFKKCHLRSLTATLESLIRIGKVHRNGAELDVKRCRTEIEKTTKRISKNTENGAKGS